MSKTTYIQYAPDVRHSITRKRDYIDHEIIETKIEVRTGWKIFSSWNKVYGTHIGLELGVSQSQTDLLENGGFLFNPMKMHYQMGGARWICFERPFILEKYLNEIKEDFFARNRSYLQGKIQLDKAFKSIAP
jgi:hypothetical protein